MLLDLNFVILFIITFLTYWGYRWRNLDYSGEKNLKSLETFLYKSESRFEHGQWLETAVREHFLEIISRWNINQNQSDKCLKYFVTLCFILK